MEGANEKGSACHFLATRRIRTLVLCVLLPLSALSQTETRPCASTPQYAQFDFWVGEWDVTDGGKTIAHSSIQRIIESCVLLENYTQNDGYSGKSINFIDGASGKWRQVWVDSRGNMSEFTGVAEDGGISYSGETHFRGGKIVKRTMKLVPEGVDNVRQYSERSTDGGQTWEVAYDYLYLRRK